MSLDQTKQTTPLEALMNVKGGPREEGTRINGLQQVIDLLRYADPAFRQSLLKRLMARDPKLAQQLRMYFK